VTTLPVPVKLTGDEDGYKEQVRGYCRDAQCHLTRACTHKFAMSALCHKRTYASAANNALFNHLGASQDVGVSVARFFSLAIADVHIGQLRLFWASGRDAQSTPCLGLDWRYYGGAGGGNARNYDLLPDARDSGPNWTAHRNDYL